MGPFLAFGGRGPIVWAFLWASIVVLVVSQTDAEVVKFSERWVKDGALDAVLVHVERGEEGLVEVASRVLGLADVKMGAVLEEPEGDLQTLFDEGVVDAG